MPVLEASGVRKQFGGVVALAGAQFALEAGEVHALIGSNGCGKSTLCKIIAGSVAADAGRLALDGRAVSFAGPREAAAAGIRVFYQDLSLIPQMSVAENIFLGREPRRRNGLVDRRALRTAATAALAEFREVLGAGIDADARVADLSADQTQIVEILKVLAAAPRIIIYDEATAALDRNQVDAVFARIRALKAEGRSIIFITHRMDEVFEIADRVTVMRNGMTVMTSATRQTTRDALVTAMVGEAHASRTTKARHAPSDETALEVENLASDKLLGVTFALRRGEILGLGGLHGQGQSDLLRALFGALPIRAGTVRIGQQPLVLKGPRAVMRRAVAYISGDRARHGVMAIRPIFENLVVSLLARERRVVVARRRLEAIILPIIERLKLKFASLDATVSELSGGNQQKVVIARWLATSPMVLLLDDPTKGIDIQTKQDLYATMDELCGHGVSILFHSSDDEELLAVADRVLVFNGGRIVAQLSGEQRTRFALYRAAYATGDSDAGA
ncbi:MAG TPA: sugar ABC transporter ATP-binding protein [Burkholderiales bacterium]|nr:sugar ABC transporter ATP-binding protein [Burkholderiales bacterium]